MIKYENAMMVDLAKPCQVGYESSRKALAGMVSKLLTFIDRLYFPEEYGATEPQALTTNRTSAPRRRKSGRPKAHTSNVSASVDQPLAHSGRKRR